jgi:hypothetical protein
MEDYVGCKELVDQTPQEHPDTMANNACLLLKVDMGYIYILGGEN